MKNKLIFIIEHDHEFRFILEDLVRDAGIAVLSAGSIDQALKILLTFPVSPDLIIMDENKSLPPQVTIPLLLVKGSQVEKQKQILAQILS